MTPFLNFRAAKISGATLKSPQILLGDPASGYRVLTPERFAGMVAGRDVLVGTHGYDNTMMDGIWSLSRLGEALAGFGLPANALFVALLWPGDSRAWKLGYPAERRTAGETGRNLAAFWNLSGGTAASLSLVSHSLGGRVILEAARHIRQPIKRICLMAAAIENTCLTEEYADVSAKVEAVGVLASRADTVLKLAFPAGNLVSFLLDPTANPLSAALGYTGPRSPFPKSVAPYPIPKGQDYDHGEYLPSNDGKDPFPDPLPDAPWKKPADFIARAMRADVQVWP